MKINSLTLFANSNSLITDERQKRIKDNLKLVNQVVNRLTYLISTDNEREDLISYGVIGLIQAVDKYDAAKGTKFEPFALLRIRGAIIDHIRSLDRLSRGSRQKVKALSATIQQLEQEIGGAPDDGQIANRLNISLSDLREIQKDAATMTLSLDSCLSEDSEETWVDQLSEERASPEEKCEPPLFIAKLEKAIEDLPERERLIIGLYHYRKLTMKEIASMLKISESRACQIHNRSISLLRSKLENAF
ncbi:MAG: sigma-70 family RNA polymerase sigma factor [Candidatus Melainabacteria bacterium]